MSTKFHTTVTVKSIEHRFVKQWIRGVGKDAEFKEDSIGWYVTFEENPSTSIYMGHTETHLKKGDRLKMTLERV